MDGPGRLGDDRLPDPLHGRDARLSDRVRDRLGIPEPRGAPVHAVVVNVNIQDFDVAREGLVTQVVPRVSQAPGFVAGYWSRSEDDTGLGMIVFESEDAARAVAEMIRSQGPDEGVTLEGVEVREVVAHA
jgi:hypothetical protein